MGEYILVVVLRQHMSLNVMSMSYFHLRECISHFKRERERERARERERVHVS